MRKLKNAVKTGLIFCGILLLLGAVLLVSDAENYKGIYEKTVRLHVLADSDEPQAQALKLHVRDELVCFLEEELSGCSTKEEAEAALLLLLPDLEKLAKDTLLEHGCTLPVAVTLSKEEYPRRVYETCTYPAGCYTSLRVHIGSGKGQNWWCVVYPPLCLSASSASGQNYSASEQALLEGREEGYKLKFALLEWGAKLYNRLKGS